MNRIVDKSRITSCTLCRIASIFISVWMVFPLFYRNFPKVIICLLFGIWVVPFIFSIETQKIREKKLISCVLLVIWLTLIISYWAFGISTNNLFTYFQQFFFWLPFLFLVPEESATNNAKPYLNILFFAITISLLINLFLLYKYPLAGEMVNRIGGEMYQEMNVGGTQHTFFAALIFMTCFFQIRQKKKSVDLIVVLIMMLVCAVYSIKMGRAISIITLCAGFCADVMLSRLKGKSIKTKLLVFIGAFLILFLVAINIRQIIDLLLSVFGGNARIKEKIIEIRSLLVDKVPARGSSSGYRIQLYIRSLKTWISSISNFFFGVGSHATADSSYELVGGHSEFFDLFAKYGLFGAAIFFLFLCSIFKSLFNMIPKHNKHHYVAILIMFVIYGVLNNITDYPATGLALFYILPLSLVADNKEVIINDPENCK